MTIDVNTCREQVHALMKPAYRLTWADAWGGERELIRAISALQTASDFVTWWARKHTGDDRCGHACLGAYSQAALLVSTPHATSKTPLPGHARTGPNYAEGRRSDHRARG